MSDYITTVVTSICSNYQGLKWPKLTLFKCIDPSITLLLALLAASYEVEHNLCVHRSYSHGPPAASDPVWDQNKCTRNIILLLQSEWGLWLAMHIMVGTGHCLKGICKNADAAAPCDVRSSPLLLAYCTACLCDAHAVMLSCLGEHWSSSIGHACKQLIPDQIHLEIFNGFPFSKTGTK